MDIPEVLAMRLVFVNGPIPAELTAATCISYCVDGSNPVISASLCSPLVWAYINSFPSYFVILIMYPVMSPLRCMHGTGSHWIVMLDAVEPMCLILVGVADGAACIHVMHKQHNIMSCFIQYYGVT